MTREAFASKVRAIITKRELACYVTLHKQSEHTCFIRTKSKFLKDRLLVLLKEAGYYFNVKESKEALIVEVSTTMFITPNHPSYT